MAVAGAVAAVQSATTWLKHHAYTLRHIPQDAIWHVWPQLEATETQTAMGGQGRSPGGQFINVQAGTCLLLALGLHNPPYHASCSVLYIYTFSVLLMPSESQTDRQTACRKSQNISVMTHDPVKPNGMYVSNGPDPTHNVYETVKGR